VPSTPPATNAAAWHPTESMITPHDWHTATLLRDGRVLVAGGLATTGDSQEDSDEAELYDPASGHWTMTGDMVQARSGHTATLLADGRVLVAGGWSNADGQQFASAELYDPASGRWTTTGKMRRARSGHTATLLPDGRVLVTGGVNLKGGEGAGVKSAELYDPSSGKWTPTGRMLEARANHTATLLADGRVLVTGYTGGGGSHAELYDPGSGRWASTGAMNTEPCSGHTATLLSDGRVLVTGGMCGTGETFGQSCSPGSVACLAELYDPGTGRWTMTGGLHADRVGHSATLLPDGTVLVVGGSRLEPPLAELYHPDSGAWTVTASPPAGACGFAPTTTALADGRVLATGSPGEAVDCGRIAVLYDPGSGR
jgi:N-acetylneuraminic acid mutarotase